MQRGIFKMFNTSHLLLLGGFSWKETKKLGRKISQNSNWPSTLANWPTEIPNEQVFFCSNTESSSRSMTDHSVFKSWHILKIMASTNIHTIWPINNNTEVRKATFVCEIGLRKRKMRNWRMRILTDVLAAQVAVTEGSCSRASLTRVQTIRCNRRLPHDIDI